MDDILIADSGEDWLKWKSDGEAFSDKEKADSRQAKDATGTLTSPEFIIQRKQLYFLIGGGKSEKLRLELLVDGNPVRIAQSLVSDNNMEPTGWNVEEYHGKSANLRVVDEEVNGMEFICIDRITLSYNPALGVLENVTRELMLDKPLLLIPITFSDEAQRRKIEIRVDGESVRIFRTSLAFDGEGDTSMPLDVSEWKGKKATIVVDRMIEGARGLESIHMADHTPSDDLMEETMPRNGTWTIICSPAWGPWILWPGRKI